VPASGKVSFRSPDILGAIFTGELLDIAEHGFRARHKMLTLAGGQVIIFAFRGREGQACTMWTRILGDEAESGFRILSS